jgi:hypothetical protein
MGFHIQEYGSAGDVKKRLSLPSAAYQAARKQEIPAGQIPHSFPEVQDPAEEKLRQGAISAITAALDVVSNDTHVTLNAFGHIQETQHTNEQMKSRPGVAHDVTEDQLRKMPRPKQATLNISLSTSL